jgi:hypothetical protein
VQGLAARDEHLERGGAAKQLGHAGRRGRYLLEVVKEDQRMSVPEVLEQRLVDPDSLGDGRLYEARVADRGE